MKKSIDVKIPEPIEFIKLQLEKIPYHIRVSFFTAAFSTFFIHLIFFTGRFANEDDRHFIRYAGWTISSGRWADKVRLASEYLLPIALFSMFILSLAITVCITIHLLHIRRIGSCMLLAVALPAFPCLAVGNAYLYMVDVYSIAMLFAALAVFVTRQYRFGWLSGALLLAVSLGEYQSYVAVAMTLCLMSVSIEFLLQELEKREFWKLVIRYLLMGASGITCYFIILRLLLKITGRELGTYKGIDSMGRIPLSQIPGLLTRTYQDFFNFFLGKRFIIAGNWLLAAYFCLGLLCVGLVVAIIVRKKIYRQPLALLFLVVLLLAFPVCANIVDLIAPESRTSILNIFAFSMVLPFACAIAELAGNFAPDTPWAHTRRALVSWGLLAVLVMINWNWFLQTNIYYSKVSSYYEHTALMCNRVFSRIERLPEFSQGADVAFVIDNNGLNYLLAKETNYSDVFISSDGLWHPIVGFYQQKNAGKPAILISNILGVQVNSVSISRIEEIKKTAAYQELDVWPADGCIGIIDGDIVVNFICLNAVVELQDDTLVFDVETKTEAIDLVGATYIWDIYRNGERIDTRSDTSSICTFTPEAPGDYYGSLLIRRQNGTKLTYTTPTITIP